MPARTRFAHGAAARGARRAAGRVRSGLPSAGERVVTDVAEQGYVAGDGTTTSWPRPSACPPRR